VLNDEAKSNSLTRRNGGEKTSMKTGREYIESLKGLKPKVYFMGEKIDSVADNPMFAPHVNTAAMTYELANQP
jgi:4-hydroxybutyryl-CoA dehydratase/vinylacetyl-CoA-Delta-isomerase